MLLLYNGLMRVRFPFRFRYTAIVLLPVILFACFLTKPAFGQTTGTTGATTPAAVPTEPDDPVCKPVKNPSVPEANCPPVIQDTFKYIAPCQDYVGDPAKTPCKAQSYVHMDNGKSWENLTDSVYAVVNGGQKYIVQHFDDQSKHLLYQIQGNVLKFLQDTTFANSEVCTGTQIPVLQKIYDGTGPDGKGNPGMDLVTKSMKCGVPFEVGMSNGGFTYSVSEEANLQKDKFYTSAAVRACPSQFTDKGPLRGSSTIIYEGPARCGSFTGNVLVRFNSSGPGAGEVYVYGEGVGLIDFDQSRDWSVQENQPPNWGPDIDGTLKDICTNNVKFCTKPNRVSGVANKIEPLPFGTQVALALIGFAQTIGINVPIHPLYPQESADKKTFDVNKWVEAMKNAFPFITPNEARFVYPGRINAVPGKNIPKPPPSINIMSGIGGPAGGAGGMGGVATTDNGNLDFFINGNVNPQEVTVASNVCSNQKDAETGQNQQFTSQSLVKSDNPPMRNFLAGLRFYQGVITTDNVLVPNANANGQAYTQLENPRNRLILAQKYACNEDNVGVNGDETKIPLDRCNIYDKSGNCSNPVTTLIGAIANRLGGGGGGQGGPAEGTGTTPAPEKKVDVGTTLQMPSHVEVSGLTDANEYAKALTKSRLPTDIFEQVKPDNNTLVKNPFKSPIDTNIDVDITHKGARTTQDSLDCFYDISFPSDLQDKFQQKCGNPQPVPSPIPLPTPDGKPRNLSLTMDAINVKDTTCRIDDMNSVMNSHPNGQESVASFMARYYFPTRGAGAQGAKNMQLPAITELQNTIAAAGYNPAFFLSIWIEESAASGINFEDSWGLGCMGNLYNKDKYDQNAITLRPGDSTDPAKVAAHIKEQTKCLISTVDAAVRNSSGTKDLYYQFMRAWAIGEYNTPFFPVGPATRADMWYKLLVGNCGVLK